MYTYELWALEQPPFFQNNLHDFEHVDHVFDALFSMKKHAFRCHFNTNPTTAISSERENFKSPRSSIEGSRTISTNIHHRPLKVTTNTEYMMIFKINQLISNIISKTEQFNRMITDIHTALHKYINISSLMIASFHTSEEDIQYIYFADQYYTTSSPDLQVNQLAYHVFNTQCPMIISDIANSMIQFNSLIEQPAYQLASWIGVPLLFAGRCVGVLAAQSYHTDQQFTINHLNILINIASQIAAVIDRQHLQQALDQAECELQHIYQQNLESFARILKLRDHETEEHSQRVVDLALQLAKSMQIPPEMLACVHHGALLHDIGKIGIPDHILFCHGALSDDEWQIMRNHPLHAAAILDSIDYLQDAIDIPRYHHEKWDGTGYPYGLKGEAIPLVARIFSIIDVWDALTSDRPYRTAWSHQQARDYIQGQSGKSFDPAVVTAFLAMIADSAVV